MSKKESNPPPTSRRPPPPPSPPPTADPTFVFKVEFAVKDFYMYEERKGANNVVLHTMEEAAEMIQQLAKHAQGRGDRLRTAEEIGDAIICMTHFIWQQGLQHMVEDSIYKKVGAKFK